MLITLLEYFAWGLLLSIVITSIAIVHRELRSITRETKARENERRRQPR